MKYNDIYILRNKDFKSLITVFQEIEPPLFCKKSGGGLNFIVKGIFYINIHNDTLF